MRGRPLFWLLRCAAAVDRARVNSCASGAACAVSAPVSCAKMAISFCCRPSLLANTYISPSWLNSFDRVAHLLPRQLLPVLLIFAHASFGRAHQVKHLPFGIAHFLQDRFGGDAAIHEPHPAHLPVELLDFGEEPAQRGLVPGIGIQHLVSQRVAFRRDYQSHDHLLAVRPSGPAVAPLGLGFCSASPST